MQEKSVGQPRGQRCPKRRARGQRRKSEKNERGPGILVTAIESQDIEFLGFGTTQASICELLKGSFI
jgi:hypothetical protein